MACISCHQNKATKILEDNYFILSFDGISLNNKKIPICHDKMTHFQELCNVEVII